MCLVRCNHRHSFQRACQCDFVAYRNPVIVTWNNLLVVRVRPFDQPCEYRGKWRTKAEVIVALSNLQFLLSWEQTADLLECFRRDNQVATRSADRTDREIHASQPMAIRRHHSHPLRS